MCDLNMLVARQYRFIIKLKYIYKERIIGKEGLLKLASKKRN